MKTLQASVTAFERALDEVPEHPEATAALCALHRAEFERALATRDDAARRHFESLALEHDDGSFAAFLEQGGSLELSFVGADAADSVRVCEVVEEGPFGIVVAIAVGILIDFGADAVLVELVEQLGQGSALHLELIERLNRG